VRRVTSLALTAFVASPETDFGFVSCQIDTHFQSALSAWSSFGSPHDPLPGKQSAWDRGEIQLDPSQARGVQAKLSSSYIFQPIVVKNLGFF